MALNKLKKTFALSLLSSLMLCGCVNSYDSESSKTNTSGDATSDTSDNSFSLEDIQKKYNNLDWSYDGEACTIRMCHWDSAGRNVEASVLNALLKGFYNRYPTIKVELEILTDYENTYGNNISANNMHDVFLVPDGAFGSWASTKKLVNLTPYVESSTIIDTDNMYSTSLTRYQYNYGSSRPGSGVQLALPKDIGPYVMYYNEDIFKQLGVELPPSDRIMTMDEATAMWQSLTKKDSKGDITCYGVGGIGIEGLVWSAGGDFLNEERDAFPSDSATLAGLKKGYQYMQDSYFKYEIQPPSEFTAGQDASTLFSMQKVATYIGGRYNVTSFKNLDFKWNVCYVPAFEENQTKNMYSGSVGYAMSSTCENKLAAWKLIEYIASREGQEILSSTGFQIPVYTDLALSEDVKHREEINYAGLNYEVFVHSAETQSYGLWQYRNNQKWKTMGYDTTSEYLYHSDPEKRWTVDYFLSQAKVKVTENL